MDTDNYLLHQVHAGKLATDIMAGTVSLVLMWQRRIPFALVIAHVPPIVATALVLRRDLFGLRGTRRGRSVSHPSSPAHAHPTSTSDVLPIPAPPSTTRTPLARSRSSIS